MFRWNFILLIVFILDFVKSSSGQDNSNDIDLIKIACDSAIDRQIKRGETIIYTEKLSSWSWLENQIDSKDTFGKYPKPTIILTKKDKKSIFKQIRIYKQYRWKDSLFNNSKRIDFDSTYVYINKLLLKRHTAIINAIQQNDTTTIINHQHYKYTRVYTFSKPIYIRDNSIAIMGFSRMCGSNCGNNQVAFYKKENGKWEIWIIISEGDY